MKTLLTTTATCLLVMNAACCFAQSDCCGIYFKASDFVNKEIFLSSCEKSDRYKIITDRVFSPNEVAVKMNGANYHFPKDSVYAVKYCNGGTVRIYNRVEYPIVNPDESILIYKVSYGPSSKGSTGGVKYYFSKDAGSKIQELTLPNVKTAFAENTKMRDLIDKEFHMDAELADYDGDHKMMKLNLVLKSAVEGRNE